MRIDLVLASASGRRARRVGASSTATPARASRRATTPRSSSTSPERRTELERSSTRPTAHALHRSGFGQDGVDRREQAGGRQHPEAGDGGQRLGRLGDGRRRSPPSSPSEHSSAGSIPAARAARSRHARSSSIERCSAVGARRPQLGRHGVAGGRLDVELGDQRARLRWLAAAAARPRDDEAVHRPGSARRASSRASSALAADRRRRTVRNEPGLDAGDDDGRPLPTLGAMEREQLDAGVVRAIELAVVDDPPAQADAVAERAARGGTPAPLRPRRPARSRSMSASSVGVG